LDLFSNDVLGSELLVGHNIYFDERVMGAEFIRAKSPIFLMVKENCAQ